MPRSPHRGRRGEAVLELLGAQARALRADEIATQLGVAGRRLPRLERLLEALADDGLLLRRRGGRYERAQRADERPAPRAAARAAAGAPELHEGALSVHPRGFGFLSAPGLPDDVWVPPEAQGGALHGDTVSFRITARTRRGLEGAVEAVVRRAQRRVAGILVRRGARSWLELDDTRVRGPLALERGGARGRDGEAAVAEITRYPEHPSETPAGRLLAILGAPGDPEVELAKLLLREGIDEEHPPEALREAEAFGRDVDPAALAGREDLTGLPLPTIDPEDARDHDDAVWVERRGDGYRAWIAIADVSHYVREGSALDAAALARGNSIYLPDRAIPMLPPALSSNLCSLLPGVLRLCLCAVIDLDGAGAVSGSRLVEGYLRSAAKLSYPGVARALGLSPHPPRSPEAESLRDGLRVAWQLAQLLRRRRLRRGALDLDLPEPRVILDDETGAPVAVQRRAHDPGVKQAYQLIEELMLLANEAVAQRMAEGAIPTLYRVHAPPGEARLERFVALCRELDVDFELGDAGSPKRLSAFLRRLAEHPRKEVLHLLLLCAMQQARYAVANIGHFGLASRAYLHFTSPIRRYPDLVVHRGLRRALRGEPVDAGEAALQALGDAAAIANERERRALEIEREAVDLYRALLMRSHRGERFEGTVAGLASGALYVALDDPFVDVRVPLESLGRERYALDASGLRAVGARSGQRIAIGDRLAVEIEEVSVPRRSVSGRRAGDERPRRPARERPEPGRRAKPSTKRRRRER